MRIVDVLFERILLDQNEPKISENRLVDCSHNPSINKIQHGINVYLKSFKNEKIIVINPYDVHDNGHN